MPMQYRFFWALKIENFQLKNVDIFLIFAQNIDCGYTLELPRRGSSYEYPHSMFWSKNKKNRFTPAYPSLTIYKVGFKGVFIARTCFPDAVKFNPQPPFIFQEEYELLQRKFMRHIFHLNAVTITSEPLPRLVVADFVKSGQYTSAVHFCEAIYFCEEEKFLILSCVHIDRLLSSAAPVAE